MFITENFIYLQLQKTGCTQIAAIMRNLTNGYRHGKHNWLDEPPPNKYIIGSIRNPWDWYVSLWAFGCGGRGAVRTRLTRRFREKLKAFLKLEPKTILLEIVKPVNMWEHLYTDSNHPALFRQWLKTLFTSRAIPYLGEGYESSSLNRYAGFLTYRYCYMFVQDFLAQDNAKGFSNWDELRSFDSSHNLLDYVIHTENLENEVLSILENIGYEITERERKAVFEMRRHKRNKSRHRETRFYYDDETIELISKREKMIIEKYDYEPPA